MLRKTLSSFSEIENLLSKTIVDLAKSNPRLSTISIKGQVRKGRGADHGDFSSPVAMALASASDDLPARQIATEIAARIEAEKPDWLERMEVAGPGFINFFLQQKAAADGLLSVLQAKEKYGFADKTGERVLVEFVSSNPTGPLHIGHGRGAAVGAALVHLYRAAGADVDSEYYINDRGRQSLVLAVSAWLRLLQIQMPEGTYRGEYVRDLASPETELVGAVGLDADQVQALVDSQSGSDSAANEARLDLLIQTLRDRLGDDRLQALCQRLHERVLEGTRAELDAMGVKFDSWFSESSLYRTEAGGPNAVDALVERMIAENSAERRDDGAVWFLSRRYGDDKDRVLVRANGEPTYFASDIAYHLGKFHRGYHRLVNVWGADHHGYEMRLRGALRALGQDDSQLQIIYVQMVSLVQAGERTDMSTRAGSFVPLTELCRQVPPDAVKLIYLSCAAGQHLDFDLQAAVTQSKDNPAFYIQYAHARLCSIERKLDESPWKHQIADENDLALLQTDKEVRLRREIDRFGSLVLAAAQRGEPHRITTYLRDLAGLFHSWYNAERLLVEDAALRRARLTLGQALRQVFANGLALLSLKAPESM